jgi:Glycosyl transferase family group 2
MNSSQDEFERNAPTKDEVIGNDERIASSFQTTDLQSTISKSKSTRSKTSSKYKSKQHYSSNGSVTSNASCVDDFIPVEPTKTNSEDSTDKYSTSDIENCSVKKSRGKESAKKDQNRPNANDPSALVTSIDNDTKNEILRMVLSTLQSGGIAVETALGVPRIVQADQDDDEISKHTVNVSHHQDAFSVINGSVFTPSVVTASSGSSKSFQTTESRKRHPKSKKKRMDPNDRPIVTDGAYYTAAYLICIATVLFFGAWESMTMTLEDGFYYRCIPFLIYPFIFAMTMFPFRIAIYNVLALFGSWRNVYKNSRFHSAIAPPKVPRDQLPPVCVQMPIYKENFVETVQPSLDDIKKAIDNYRKEGGEAFMFINDDGLQLIDEEERQIRINYYKEHDIAYIARPGHNVLPRHGLFKKASNMNFCLNFAMEVAEQYDKLESMTNPIEFNGSKMEPIREDEGDELSVPEQSDRPLSAHALQEVMNTRDYPIMAGGPIERLKQVRYILIVDSDTRVPETCLYDTVGEFVYDDEVGFVQHATSVLRVDDNYWEAMLAHFTHLLYSVFIPMGTALGEPSPLVGHNATLNWQAIQEVSWYDEEVGYRKYWSESHVSEDFDLSMRLQSAGYIGRYALYTGDGFQEGVSVTVHDEIKKLKKFAYGSGEMIFHPCKDWCRKGLISPLLRNYLTTNSIPWHARVNLVAYLFTYVAMSYGIIALPMAFYIGFLDSNDMNLPSAWQLMIGTFLIFGVIGSTNGVLYTLFLGHHQSFTMALFYEMTHLLPLSVFYTGVQYHICTCFFRYMFSMKAEWGATVKELDSSFCNYTFTTFLGETLKTMHAYWDMYVWVAILSFVLAVYFLFLGPASSVYWSGWAASPLCLFLVGHALMPILFNPIAMRSLIYPIQKRFCIRRRKQAGNNDNESSISQHDESSTNSKDKNPKEEVTKYEEEDLNVQSSSASKEEASPV